MDNRKAKRQLRELENLARQETFQDSIPTFDPEPSSKIKLEWMNKSLLKEEILYEYLCFLRTFPDFLLSEKEKLISIVRSELKISEIEESFSSLRLENLIGPREYNFILENLSAKLGQSLK